MPASMLKPEALCHVGFIVHDVEATASKYAAALGLPMPSIIETPGYDCAKTLVKGEPSETTARLAFFQTGQLVVELIQPSQHPSAWRDHLNEHGESVHHIAFGVDDTKATEWVLNEAGMPTQQQGLYADASGMYTYLDSASQLGVIVELLEDFKR